MKIDYSETNTHVEDSYKCKEINIEVMEIIRERHRKKLPVTRTFESYEREWRGHNRLYRLHIARNHTKDVDLQEKETIFEKIVWLILGGF